MDKNTPQAITYYSKVADLSFYILGHEENSIESCGTVLNKEIMKNDVPFPGGIYDSLYGSTDASWNCSTCHNRKGICPGHPGVLELKYPVKSPLFRDELLKWLKVVCYHCNNIVAPIKYKVKPEKRLNELIKTVRTVKTCIHCKQVHQAVAKDKRKPSIFYRVLETEAGINKTEFYNHQIKAVLQGVSEQTVLSLGKPLRCHPSKFIIGSIRVPPNTMRPDIRRVGGARSSNSDTTSILKTIVEINEALPDDIPTADQISNELHDAYFNLDNSYYVMVKGGGGGDIKMLTNTNKAPVAIAEHFPKKTGRIRRNLMGKRVENMIRSVITGDSRLKIYEVGIPMIHARNIEIPEVVTEKNKERLTTYFMNKADHYPGCKRLVKKADGNTYRIELLNPNYQLQLGDIIMRDMITGDYVAFNRQPSLLFSNISGMRVVVMETGDTLRINPSICSYYNADFDGDFNWSQCEF